MKKRKRHLSVLQDKDSPVVTGIACFAAVAQHRVKCQRKSCRHWIKHPAGRNCVMVTAMNGRHTLQKIGEIYKLTRMRICQIEKDVRRQIAESCEAEVVTSRPS